jgi:hypothetical protein
MKALSSLLLLLAICVATVIPSSAAADKQLTNVRGDVTYQLGTAAAQPVAPSVSVAIANSAFAKTGPNSQAKITLPDSSQVLIGQDTQIQMAAFDQQPNITTAKFILVNGKTRFTVQHPNGAKANYTFQTSTGQIAVRGTEGDISVDTTQMQVNVYQLGDPNLPVEVTLNNGKKYTLGAGQALVVGITGAVIAAAAVSAVTSPLTSTFAEFGAPGNSAAAAGAVGAAGAAGAVAPAAIAVGAAAVVAGAVVAGSTHGGTASTPHTVVTPTPSPSPSPKPPGKLKVSQTQFNFQSAGQQGTFTASQTHFSGPYTITNISDSTVVTFASTTSTDGNFSFTTSNTGGTTTFDVNGATGTAAVPASVTARSGTISLTPALQTFTTNLKTQNATAKEYGFGGTFTAAMASGSLLAIGGTSPNFTFTAQNGGTGTLNVSDGTNLLQVPVKAALGIQGLPKSIALLAGKTQSFTASEAGATTLSASIDKTSVSTVGPATGSASGQLFTVTAVAFGSATLTMSDGVSNANTVSIPITVTSPSPSPMPSTTCVPIIIHARHGGLRGPDAAATPCPTASPSPPPTTRSAPHPHPVGPPRPSGPPVTKPYKPAPQHTPGNPMHPMQPLNGPPGAMTPPPLPIPPGGGP